MKNLAVLTFLFVLVANATITSASTDICLHKHDQAATMLEKQSESGMPCHHDPAPLQVNQVSQYSDYNQGSCLCIYGCVQQSSMLDGYHFVLPMPDKALINFLQNNLESISLLPPRRPPKSYS